MPSARAYDGNACAALSHPAPAVADRMAEANQALSREAIFSQLEYQWNPASRTAVFQSKKKAQKKGQPIIVFLHGQGATFSHSFGMRFPMALFNAERSEVGVSSSIRALQGFANWRPVRGESLDLPESGMSEVPLSEVATLAQTAQYLANHIRGLLVDDPDAPVFIYSKSGSAAIAVETGKILNRERRIVRGLILTSPMYPGDAALLQKNRDNLEILDREAKITTVKPVMDWIYDLHREASWDGEDPFGGIETLILTGSLDREVLPEERARFKALERIPGVRYVDIPDAGHDLFEINRAKRHQMRQAAGEIYSLLERVLGAP